MAETVIKRVGGKIKIREWIKSLLPFHTVYCEPFGGSFAVGFIMPRSNADYRLVYNDLDSNVWNLFRVLRDNKEELIEKVNLTPYSREELENAVKYIESGIEKKDPVEWARNYLIYNRQSMFGKEDGTWCVSRTGENICLSWRDLEPIMNECADFFRGVYIENTDYRDCIKKWDCEQTLFYIDPPYEAVEKDFYKVNRKSGFSHSSLANVVKNMQGSCAISYYDSDYIRELYKESDGFSIYTKDVVKHMQIKDAGKKTSVTEILIVKKNNFASKHVDNMCFSGK